MGLWKHRGSQLLDSLRSKALRRMSKHIFQEARRQYKYAVLTAPQ